jgi:hypothetical protein
MSTRISSRPAEPSRTRRLKWRGAPPGTGGAFGGEA